MTRHVLVVGAGIGGLTASSLLAQDGWSVTLLEASSELGGCASKFKRHKYLFPVGATLGMGLEPGGIHERVFRYLGKPMSIEPLARVMEMVHRDSTFVFHQDRAQHVDGIVAHFPSHSEKIRAFYKEIFAVAATVRTLMDPLPALPPATANEWAYLVKSMRPQHIKLLPFFNQTLDQRLKKHDLNELHEFRHMLDGLLIDSMQTGSEDVAYLLAAVALDIYHEGAYYVPGGLYRFAELMGDSLTENGGVLKKRRTIEKLERQGDGWIATDHRGNTYDASDVILNVPIQQLTKILAPELVSKLKVSLRDGIAGETWATLTLYMAIDSTKLVEPLPAFRQISTGDGLAEGGHFFMSSSLLNDELRAPEGFQTVTISTHSRIAEWDSREKYEETREILTERILQAIQQVVPGFREAIVHMESGAPKAWERFAGRVNGLVGGFPQTLDASLFHSISHHSGLPNLYVCGDHIFPGGGTIGAAASGIHAARSVSGKRLI
ncbi:phytoene desaturase family protein [Planococcus halocryophilus]|uniref:phytoene desaturase family protein n=1 Tax=Planococcus halocryophilus TaxID=1215089 RepID=UPI001F1157E9|nr:FAD-dependent oxidoreductase [Planococcus halocryophilus]MCH4826701.1 NAD(P)/FAD-dependent oxidoreductase [Planococcus halocryophilus]